MLSSERTATGARAGTSAANAAISRSYTSGRPSTSIPLQRSGVIGCGALHKACLSRLITRSESTIGLSTGLQAFKQPLDETTYTSTSRSAGSFDQATSPKQCWTERQTG